MDSNSVEAGAIESKALSHRLWQEIQKCRLLRIWRLGNCRDKLLTAPPGETRGGGRKA